MSVDWNVVCSKCNQYHHLGQDMGGQCTFGYGSTDDAGSKLAGEFISKHLAHNFVNGEYLRIVHTVNLPIGCRGVG